MSKNIYEYKINKYKNKIINLTGGFKLDGSVWIPVFNRGQHNCGVWEHAIDKNKFLKCVNNKSDPIQIKLDVAGLNVFPKIYGYHRYDGKTYIEYEKLDGDITSIFFELIPTRVLESMGLSEDISNKLMKLHQWKTPNTNSKSHEKPVLTYITPLIIYIYENNKLEEFKEFQEKNDIKIFDGHEVPNWLKYNEIKQIIDNINILKSFDMNGITIELYDSFMNNIFDEIDKVYYQIIKSICRLYVQTYEKGYILHDFKFDNYGYKIIDSSDESNEQRYGEELFEKKFNIYALDEESNFSIKTEYDSYQHLQYYIDDMFESFAVNGQYNMFSYNKSINNDYKTINKNLYDILSKYYSYNANERMLKLGKPIINLDEIRSSYISEYFVKLLKNKTDGITSKIGDNGRLQITINTSKYGEKREFTEQNHIYLQFGKDDEL